MTLLAKLTSRGLIKVSGTHAADFLQGLITQDVMTLAMGQGCYGCLLTPQGKYLYDFFVLRIEDGFLLDCEGGDRLISLMRLLKLYVLRSPVTLENVSDQGTVVVHDQPHWPQAALTFQDPRDPRMGFRSVVMGPVDIEESEELYTRRRLSLVIPEGAGDLTPQKSIVLEYGFDELQAFSWTKGCYMGQELMARTKHRGLVRKKVFGLAVDEGHVPAPDALVFVAGEEAGYVTSTFGSQGFALLRLEKLEGIEPEKMQGAFDDGRPVRIIPRPLKGHGEISL